MRLVFGIGINNMPKGSCIFYEEGKKKNKHYYSAWKGLLRRSYEPACQERQPAYKGCSVCEGWLTLSKFKEWYDQQYIEEGFQLDKDIIKKGNKVYCPEYCRFVPRSLNNLLLINYDPKSSYLIGVDLNKGKYRARCSLGKKDNKHLGYFETELEAHNAWRLQKADSIENIVEDVWSEYPKLDIRIKDSLLDRATKLRQLDIPVEEFY